MCDICPICHEALRDGNTSALSHCNHIFHSQCIIEAMRTHRHGPGVCPVCRDPGEHDAEIEFSDEEGLGFQPGEASLNISEMKEVKALMYVRRSAFEALRTMSKENCLCVVRQLVLWSEAADVDVAPSFSDHIKLLPVSEPLVAVCMKLVLEVFQEHGYIFPHSGWRESVRAELGSNCGDIMFHVGWTLFADAFVKGAVRASVVLKRTQIWGTQSNHMVIGDLESNMYDWESGEITFRAQWLHTAGYNRLKTKFYDGKLGKADVIHLVQECLVQRDRHHSVPLQINEELGDMVQRCIEHSEWDPVREVRAAIESEKEFGMPSANSIAKRVAAAKAQANAAKKNDFIGNPECNFTAYRCMEIIFAAEVKMRLALYRSLGTQRSLDLFTAWGYNEATQLPRIPSKSIPLVQQKIIRPGVKPKKRGNVRSSIPLLKMKAKPAAIIRPKATTHFHKKASKAKAAVPDWFMNCHESAVLINEIRDTRNLAQNL